jgi:hypothetical protein
MSMPLVNLTALNACLTSIEVAYGAGNQAVVRTGLNDLHPLVQPLPGGTDLAARVRRLASGRSAIPRTELDQTITAIRAAKDEYVAATTEMPMPTPDATRGSGVLGSSRRYLIPLQGGAAYLARTDQSYIAQRAAKHFRLLGYDGELPKRGIFRMDTGMGKSLTYGFCIQSMRRAMPEVFDDALVIIGCHQMEPAQDVARQIKALFPREEVAYLQGGLDRDLLRGITFVAGTYQQLAQESTVAVLKEWVGRRRVLFVLDEADMVVFKGIKVDENDEPDLTGWHASWFRPFIEFGLFNEKGHYNARTKHYMLGASATLDRPDGIPLSTVWGPGNVFYHTPMAEGIRKGLLVPVVGKVLEMEVPEGADIAAFREFTTIENGKVVVDSSKVMSAAGSDYAVKTAVRAYLDHIFMDVGVGQQKGRTLREGIGYASDRAALEKHMRWQQDLFDLIEKIFMIHNGLNSPKPMRVDTVVRHLGGARRMTEFGKELQRFLYAREWRQVDVVYRRCIESLGNGRMNGVKDLFGLLYEILNVDARRIKGSRLVATAVWQDMDEDESGHRVVADEDDLSIDTAVRRYPNAKWPNRFGPRSTTMRAVKSGEHDIDMVWSIGMLDRGFNAPGRSLAVDNAPTESRRMTVQRVGRITRPPDGRNPTDHSRKPEAFYITVTPNLEVHRIDLSRSDLARVFGSEIDPELNLIRIHAAADPKDWKTPDTVQLDLKEGKTLHLVRVGANTARAIADYLKARYGDGFDPEVIAFDAEIALDEITHLLSAIRFPKEKQLRNWLTRWRADDATILRIMATYHSDLADMKTVYGGAWKVVTHSEK